MLLEPPPMAIRVKGVRGLKPLPPFIDVFWSPDNDYVVILGKSDPHPQESRLLEEENNNMYISYPRLLYISDTRMYISYCLKCTFPTRGCTFPNACCTYPTRA